jgi:hypothetical protein
MTELAGPEIADLAVVSNNEQVHVAALNVTCC